MTVRIRQDGTFTPTCLHARTARNSCSVRGDGSSRREPPAASGATMDQNVQFEVMNGTAGIKTSGSTAAGRGGDIL